MAVNPLTNDDASSMHGIPMTAEAFEHLIGLASPYRYELIDGLVYDMTGSSPEHADIADNIHIVALTSCVSYPFICTEYP